MTATDRLVIWLRAQLTEDERLALTVHGDGCVLFTYEWQKDCDCEYPVRAVADVKAKRSVLDALVIALTCAEAESEEYGAWAAGENPPNAQRPSGGIGRIEGLRHAIRLLAQPYAGRDGWQPEWSVTT